MGTVAKKMQMTKTNKKNKKKKKKKKRDRQAFLANKHDLYQKSVQEPEADTHFFDEVFEKEFGGEPKLLREDFCGTGYLSATWVREKEGRRAIGYDLDPEPVKWGEENNLSELTDEQRSRVELRLSNVLDASEEKADVICALNFSWWTFKKRLELLEYFRIARSNLAEEGLFVLDMYGGSEAYEELEEEDEKDGFSYLWDQEKVCAITDEVICHISFLFPDGSKLKNVFTYDWRRYGMRETQEILVDAGFSRVDVYWEGVDEDGEGDGEFILTTEAENTESWIAYLVAVP